MTQMRASCGQKTSVGYIYIVAAVIAVRSGVTSPDYRSSPGTDRCSSVVESKVDLRLPASIVAHAAVDSGMKSLGF